ncbi:hypothetical protein [Microtetraspora fusca]|uniref:Uncharacterized protein n=1 Tax=Microtetraspora fusca TaxID=1997 RepID=A0ABW6V2H2_MICFU|nr:hypothetical protein [Microtetraspora fusca]
MHDGHLTSLARGDAPPPPDVEDDVECSPAPSCRPRQRRLDDHDAVLEIEAAA